MLVVMLLVLLSWHAGSAHILKANPVLEWNELMLAAIRADNSGPTLSTRNLAILHCAMYDAVNAIEQTGQPYQFQVSVASVASPEAAAIAAGHQVVESLYPSFHPQTDILYQSLRGALADTESTTNGLAIGQAAADALLQARSADGSNTQVPYIPSTEPGQWRRTPPFYRPPLDPHWRYVQLFALPDKEPFVAPPPPPLSTADYAEALNEVKTLGAEHSKVRTAEQSQIAVFWSDFSYTAMPPGHWHEIAASIVAPRGLDLASTARLFALLSLAQADAAIVCWEGKYRYNLWRPITAIWRAEQDANPETQADPEWNHFLAAPSFPEYPSGHSTFSKASAEVLSRFFGTDAISFTVTSDTLPGVTRSFHSLAACADEVGMSRIHGGIHFQFSNRQGKLSGARVAQYVCNNYLLLNNRLPLVRLEAVETLGAWLRVHGHLGRNVVLEASANLRDWTAVATNTAVVGGLVVHDPTQAALRFYRIRQP
jgi:hypothetical protein